jgi:hypothetical protein
VWLVQTAIDTCSDEEPLAMAKYLNSGASRLSEAHPDLAMAGFGVKREPKPPMSGDFWGTFRAITPEIWARAICTLHITATS